MFHTHYIKHYVYIQFNYLPKEKATHIEMGKQKHPPNHIVQGLHTISHRPEKL